MPSSVNDFLVDFNKEEDSGGGGGPRYKPGTYKVRIVVAKTGISEQKDTPYLSVTFAFLEGNYRKQKKKIEERLYNSPKAMRRFRLLLQAVGIKVPKKLDLVKLVPKLKGKDLYIEIEDDEREGYKTRSRVSFEGFINEEDYDPDAEAEDEDLEDEDEEEDEDEDEDDEDDDDLEDEDEDDLEDEDEDEEEPAPKKRSSKKKAKPAAKKSSSTKKKRSSKKAKEEDEEDEDLAELDLDEL